MGSITPIEALTPETANQRYAGRPINQELLRDIESDGEALFRAAAERGEFTENDKAVIAVLGGFLEQMTKVMAFSGRMQ